MSKELEKKTEELIKLADGSITGVNADGQTADEKRRKKGTAGKVILSIIGIILVLALALVGTGCGLFVCATADEMPDAPEVTELDTTAFILDAVKEIITQNTITLTPETINEILARVTEQVNASTDILRIDDFFCEMENSMGTLYARVYIDTIEVKGITVKIDRVVPVQADFNVSFDDETKEIIAQVGQINCGKLNIPDLIVHSVLAKVSLPKDVSIDENGCIRYDTTTLDAMIDEAMSDAITSSVSGTLGGLLSDFATSLVNVELTGAEIDGSELVISGTVF